MISLIATTTPFIVLFYGCLMVKSSEITAGTLISYFTYTSLLFSPIYRLINLVPQLKQMSISLDRINFMLKRKKN
ncbi:hypothetical protein [Clostridium felsineum]|uniref:hypothetical protein n=1 Tax=Clostridium felsineum TaxID=36839 RepID=UPI0020336627|nr:hypothetical protein [Clostridium felsineum]